MAAPADPIIGTAKALLLCVEGKLLEYDARVCRSFVAPGGPPAWDTCTDDGAGAEGQAWVQIGQVGPTDNFPTIQTGAMRCWPPESVVEFTVGILRCAATVDDHGNPPPASRLTFEAEQVQRDRAIVDEAIRCCFLADAEPGTYSVGLWTPLGPSGGCVGGSRNVTVAVRACGCPPA